jgi:hypothetical protein
MKMEEWRYNYTPCLYLPVRAGTHNEKLVKSHICRGIVCFGLEAKTDHKSTGKQVSGKENALDRLILRLEIRRRSVVSCTRRLILGKIYPVPFG